MSLPLAGLAQYFNRVANDMEPLSVVGGFGYIGGGTGSVFSDDAYVRGFSNPYGGSFAQKYYGGFGSSQSTMMSGKAYAFDGLKCYNDFKASLCAGVQAPPQIKLIPPGEGAAGQAGGVNQANPRSNVDLNSDNDSEERTIPGDAQDDAVTKLVKMGYSDREPENGGVSEAREIVDRMVAASEGDQTRFNTMLDEIPAKTKTVTDPETNDETTVPNHDWAEDFGEWYVHHIKGMGTLAAQDYVHEIAFDAFVRPDSNSGPYVKAKRGETVQIDVNGDGQTESARVYTVTEDSGTDIPEGTEIYRVGNNSHAKWFVKRGDGYEEIPFKPKGNVNGSSVQLYVGRLDSLEVTPSGTETGADGYVYEVYTVQGGSADGQTAESYAGYGTLYHRNGKWYYSNGFETDADGESRPVMTKLETQPSSFKNGRLTFGGEPQYVAREGFDASLDAEDYMALLDEGVADATAHATELETAENQQNTQTVSEVARQLRDLFGEVGLEVIDSEDGKKIELNVTPEFAGAVVGTIEMEGNKDKLNALLDSLPAGTRIMLNGSPLVGSTNRADRIIAELNKIDATHQLDIQNTVDLRNEDTVEGVKEELRRIIRQQQISQGTMNPLLITFSAVQLPESVVPDAATLQTLLEEVAREEGITYNAEGTLDGSFLIYEDGQAEPAKVISASTLDGSANQAEVEAGLRSDMLMFDLPGVTSETPIEFIWWNAGESTSAAAEVDEESGTEGTGGTEGTADTSSTAAAEDPAVSARVSIAEGVAVRLKQEFGLIAEVSEDGKRIDISNTNILLFMLESGSNRNDLNNILNGLPSDTAIYLNGDLVDSDNPAAAMAASLAIQPMVDAMSGAL